MTARRSSAIAPHRAVVGGVALIPGNLLTLNEQDIETDATGWAATARCTIAQSLGTNTGRGIAFDGAYCLAMTCNSAGTMNATSATSSGARYPVTAGHIYLLSGYAEAGASASARSCQIFVNWYNASAGLISTSTVSATDATSGWTHVFGTVTAPALAVTAKFVVQVVSAALGEVHYFDYLSMVDNTLGLITGNMLTLNQQDVETDATGWAVSSNCTLAQSSAQAYTGVYSLAMTCQAASVGSMDAITSTGTSPGYPVVPGTTYAIAGQARANTTGRTVTIQCDFYNGTAYLSTLSVSAVDTNAGWTLISGNIVAPATASKCDFNVMVTSPGTGEVHYIDHLSLIAGAAGGGGGGGGVTTITGNLLTLNAQDIETDATGWTVLTNCTIAQSATFAKDGTNSLSMTSVGAGLMQAEVAAVLAVTAGTGYTVSAYLRAAVSGRTTHINVDWKTSSGTFISTSTIAGTDTTGSFTQTTGVVTAPTGATQAVLYTDVVGTGGAAEVHYLDYVSMVANAGSIVPTPVAMQTAFPVLHWNDEFPGTTLDTTKWGYYEYGGTSGNLQDADNGGGITAPGNVSVSSGVLTLLATSATPATPASWGCGYINTWGFASFKGPFYIEIRAKCPPPSPGTWPAISFYEAGWAGATTYAELDVLEAVSTPDAGNAYGAFQSWHGSFSASYQIGAYGIDLTGWHTYGVSVDASGNIQYWFDGAKVGSVIAGGATALQQMDLSIGMTISGNANGSASSWAGVPTGATPSPQTMQVDYVRVFTAS